MMIVMTLMMVIKMAFAVQVGQMQLLRRQIAHQLHMSCKFNSKFLASALNTINEYALLISVLELSGSGVQPRALLITP